MNPHLHDRLSALLTSLEVGLVERRRVLRLALLAALAGEHTLLIGPPGTAKSELARRLHLAFHDASYFERLLTRFSVPEELFGPLSISALEQDRYERQTEGYLPQASIAFIDEVFKANSAILNALLTLLNERLFDNGAGRQACPLISVIAATNEVPEDEVGEAFFDRFLLRLPVTPVSPAGFSELLALPRTSGLQIGQALDHTDRAAVCTAAQAVLLPAEVARLLGESRAWLAEQSLWVSDRRWVKIVWLLKVAAATEGRASVRPWDLWLLPWCVAADEAAQHRVNDWLVSRLGIGEAMTPPRLTRVVEAFEAQALLEQDADDLDYDASGRLKFSAEINDNVADAKGAAQVTRMKYTRRRRYGASHIGARTRQIDELEGRISAYLAALRQLAGELAAGRTRSLWMDPEFAARALASLDAGTVMVDGLLQRALAARAAFEALPRLDQDPLRVPEPIPDETLV